MPRARRKKIEWKKVVSTDRLSLYQDKNAETLFSVRWKRSDGSYGSRRFSALRREEAIREAPYQAGLEIRQRNKEFRIVDAFNECLAQTNRGLKSRQDWNYYVKRFMAWLQKHNKDIQHWHLLTRPLIRQYLKALDGKSATMRRLAMQPICQTSGYMHREYGCVYFAERMGIGSKLEKTPPMVYIEDVFSFLDFLKEKDPRLEVGACLQALGGLQLQEARRLTWSKVRLSEGLVEISGEVKNPYRNRVIPVCDRVLEALKRAGAMRGSGGVQNLGETVLKSEKGFAFGNAWHNYSQQISRAIREWNPEILWKPKDLRNCLSTFGTMLGIKNDVWEQYIGHAPQSVTGRHYIPRLASVSEGEANALKRQMDMFRGQLTTHVDAAYRRYLGGEILNFFEPVGSNQRMDSKNGETSEQKKIPQAL